MKAADLWNILLLDHLHERKKVRKSYTPCTQTSFQRTGNHSVHTISTIKTYMCCSILRKYPTVVHTHFTKTFRTLFFVNPWFGGGSNHFIEFMDSKNGWKEKKMEGWLLTAWHVILCFHLSFPLPASVSHLLPHSLTLSEESILLTPSIFPHLSLLLASPLHSGPTHFEDTNEHVSPVWQ